MKALCSYSFFYSHLSRCALNGYPGTTLKKYTIMNGLPDLSCYDLIDRSETVDTIVMTYRKKSKEFLSPVTNELECVPEIGELAIFWDYGKERNAIIARLSDKDYATDLKYSFMIHTGEWYDNAIRFRNPEQFNKVTKYRGNVAEEKKEG